MKKFLASLLLLLVFACHCLAGDDPNERSLLWKISGNGLSRPSYLFGTIHLICPEDYLWTPVMGQSLAASEQVCLEMDMDDPGLLTDAMGGMMDTSGKRLMDYFTPEQYGRLRRFMRDSMGINIGQLQMLSPMILQTLILARSVNCPLPVSYETSIMEEAQKQHKEIIGLESVQDQLSLLTGIPADSVANMVMDMVDSFSSGKQEFAQMVSAYKSQDLPALFELIKKAKEPGDEMAAFLDERNKKWIPRMRSYMSKGPVFFAVGAAHLSGSAGVIHLLREQGYTVTPLR